MATPPRLRRAVIHSSPVRASNQPAGSLGRRDAIAARRMTILAHARAREPVGEVGGIWVALAQRVQVAREHGAPRLEQAIDVRRLTQTLLLAMRIEVRAEKRDAIDF